MSTITDISTTENPGSGAALLLRAGKLAGAAFAVVFAWFVAVGVLTYFTEISPT
jgi:hypothetical protein